MQSERNIGQVDAKRSCASARAAQQASDDRFGGKLTAHCYRDGGAFAPKPAVRLSWVERVKPTRSGHPRPRSAQAGFRAVCEIPYPARLLAIPTSADERLVERARPFRPNAGSEAETVCFSATECLQLNRHQPAEQHR